MTDERKKEKKKPIFEKVELVFRNPVRADIMKELDARPQRAIDLQDNIGVPKQNINYHLNALKKGGLVQTHKKEVDEFEEVSEDLPNTRGVRINGISKKGKLKVSYGIELTKNGKDVVNQFINPLYEQQDVMEDTKLKKKSKKK